MRLFPAFEKYLPSVMHRVLDIWAEYSDSIFAVDSMTEGASV